MSIKKLKAEAETLQPIQESVAVFLPQGRTKKEQQLRRILQHIVKNHFLREHIQDLAYSLLELKVAVFQKDYVKIHRLVMKFTTQEQTNIRELKEEITTFSTDITALKEQFSTMTDTLQEYYCSLLKELEQRKKLYIHIIEDIERLFKEIHQELEGSN